MFADIRGALWLHPSLPEGLVHKELAKGFSNRFTECMCVGSDMNPGRPVLQFGGGGGLTSGHGCSRWSHSGLALSMHKVGTRWAQLARLALAQKHRMERVLAFCPKVTLCWLSLAFGNGSLGRKGDK